MTDHTALRQHILNSFPATRHEPMGCLKHPYLVPGAGYAHCLWDWDSLWTAVANYQMLREPDCPATLTKAEITRHAQGCLDNYFEHQAEDGAMPIMIVPENPDYFQCRERPECNMAKPVFATFAELIWRETGSLDVPRRHLDGLVRFHQAWRRRYLSKCGLFVWGSDLAIGVDDDPAVFARPRFSAGHLYLNCLMLKELRAAGRLAAALGKPEDAARYNTEAATLDAVIQQECWDERDGAFYSVDVQVRLDPVIPNLHNNADLTWNSIPLKILTWTTYLPLWTGSASLDQAERVARYLDDPTALQCPCGIRTLAACERKMYTPDRATSNPSVWRGPVWIIANYLTAEALAQAGLIKQARAMAEKTIALMAQDLAQTGTLHEYYHPDTGKGLTHPGFMNWNALALNLIAMLEDRPRTSI